MHEATTQAIETIRNGGVILYPTDTIWGLGCDPNNKAAIEKLNAIKKRQAGKHFILLVDAEHRLYNYVNEIPDICFELTKFQDEPLTIVYPGGKNVDTSVLGDDGSLGIRICEMKETQHLLQRLKHGLLSTSANISGEKSALTFQDIPEEIKSAVDYIFLPQTILPKRKASSIIKVEMNGEIRILRK